MLCVFQGFANEFLAKKICQNSKTHLCGVALDQRRRCEPAPQRCLHIGRDIAVAQQLKLRCAVAVAQRLRLQGQASAGYHHAVRRDRMPNAVLVRVYHAVRANFLCGGIQNKAEVLCLSTGVQNHLTIVDTVTVRGNLALTGKNGNGMSSLA